MDVARVRDGDAERAEANEQGWKNLMLAMNGALDRGIDVVATTYPSVGEKPGESEIGNWYRQDLETVCRTMAPPPGELVASASKVPQYCERPGRGRFALASPMIAREGQHRQLQITFRVNPSHHGVPDMRLAQVIRTLMNDPGDVHAVDSLCRGNALEENGIAAIDEAASETIDATHALRLRFRGTAADKRVTALPINTLEDLKHFQADIRNKFVVIGTQTYPGLDEWATPVSPKMSGVLVHAHIANSIDQPVCANHWIAAGADLGLGVCFVAGFLLLPKGKPWATRKWGAYPGALLMVVLPSLIFGGFIAFAVVASVFSYAHGRWLDPLPILVGLALHFFGELSEHAYGTDHDDPSEHSHDLCGWLAETRDAWCASLHCASCPVPRGIHVKSAVRLGMFIVVLWALVSLTFH